MFVNWAHFLIPKVFIVLSLIANPIFVNLIHTEKVFKFGDYRYLLYFFAGFNVTSALSDLLVPIVSIEGNIFVSRVSSVFTRIVMLQ